LNVPAPGIMARQSIYHEPYTNRIKRQLMRWFLLGRGQREFDIR